MDFLPKSIQKYVDDHSGIETTLLEQVNRETHLHVLRPRMLSGHHQGRALALFSKMIQPEYILEVGTYTGYSALCLAEGLKPSGKLITIELNEELEPTIRKYLTLSQYAEQIELIIGDAKDILLELTLNWDLIFIDADKESYSLYYELVLPYMKSGAFMVIDNVLWSGKVVDPDENDKVTTCIRQFNQKVQEDDRVENVLLPIRDGMMILRKL